VKKLIKKKKRKYDALFRLYRKFDLIAIKLEDQGIEVKGIEFIDSNYIKKDKGEKNVN